METLHHHKVLLRTIIPSMLSKLHLVWFHRTIYIMPIPDYLLNARFYSQIFCNDSYVYAELIGFLRSYCFLIRFPIDLTVAKDLRLISDEVTWTPWSILRQAILLETQSISINKRYEYGELRLHRLNLIYRFTRRRLSYFTVHREYQTYFAEYFAVFATAFAFVATILTAMQNVINIQGVPASLIKTCYRFSIAVLVGICACFGYIGVVFVVLYSYNFARARSAQHRRHSGA